MTAPITSATPGAVPDAREVAKIRQTAQQLEGLFVRQLFAAMRETVPTDGGAEGGAGEEMFTGMMHENLADTAPTQWSRGLAAGIARQLQARLNAAAAPEAK